MLSVNFSRMREKIMYLIILLHYSYSARSAHPLFFGAKKLNSKRRYQRTFKPNERKFTNWQPKLVKNCFLRLQKTGLCRKKMS